MARRVIAGDLFQESWVELDATIHQLEEEAAAAVESGSEKLLVRSGRLHSPQL